MYQLIMYDDNKIIREVIQVDNDVQVNGKRVEWSTNSISGIKLNFIIIDSVEEFKEGDTISDSTIQNDLKASFKKVDLEAENNQLKADLENLKKEKLNTDLTIVDMFEQMNNNQANTDMTLVSLFEQLEGVSNQ